VIPICYPHSVGGCGSSGGTCDATLYNYSIHLRELLELGKEPNQFAASMLRGFVLERNRCCGGASDSAKCHLPIEYAADLTPVVAGKEAGASWNGRGMEKALDF